MPSARQMLSPLPRAIFSANYIICAEKDRQKNTVKPQRNSKKDPKKIKRLKNEKKGLHSTRHHAIVCKSTRHGSLVKRLRRRPLTAKTGVRFS